MTRKGTPTDIQNAINAYIAGESLENCARLFSVGYDSFRNEIISRGLLRTPKESQAIATAKRSKTVRLARGLPDSEIVNLYIAGRSENSLAKQFGIARNGIRARLLSAGVEIRDSTAANRLMMSKRTPEENRANVMAANLAATGRKHSIEEKIKRANTRQANQTHSSANELILAEWLKSRGIDSVPQQAVHCYNLDLGIYPVAVEIFGGGWHAYGEHAAAFRERTNYLLNAGWWILFVWVDRRNHPLRESCADYAVRFIEQARGNPSPRGEYRMIWGDGKPVSSRRNFHKLTIVEP